MSATQTIEKQETFLADDERFIGRVDTPYTVQLISAKNAHSHAALRSRQLNCLLLLMTGDGFDVFDGLSTGPKQDVLWLAQQFAAEIENMVDLVVKATKERAQ